MGSFLAELFCSIRHTTSQSFRSLPVLLGSAIFVLGLVQANLNLLFFFVGMFILTPLATVISNMIFDYVFDILDWFMPGMKIFTESKDVDAAQCALFTTPVYGAEFKTPVSGTVVPAYWLTMMAFFFSYLYFNASSLHDVKPEPNAPKKSILARESQSFIAMITVIITAILFTFARFTTSCDTGFGVLISWILGIYLAYFWYGFMRSCGLGRLDDIFGISNQLLPHQSFQDEDPTVCVPVSKA